MFAVPSFFGYNTTFVSTPVATAATGVGETSFTANWNTFAGAEYYLLDVSTSPSFSSFVFQDQVVLAPTTSYVVIGLTASTTYYYRLRASTDPYFDPDAAAFFARVTAAGGALTTTEQNATNQLVLDMKSAGIWSAMKAIYPMVGASAAACAQNLKSSSFTGTFSSGWTFASTGVTPNGTSAYFDTGIVPNSILNQNSSHISIYHNQSGTSPISIGSSDNGYANGIYISPRYPGLDNAYIRVNDSTGVVASNSDSSGFWIATRTASNVIKVFKQNTTFISGSTSSSGLSTRSIYVGGGNIQVTEFSSLQITIASIGDGLTDTQASNFYTAVQAFQTTLSRNV
jgi:hypothetical protein